MDATSDLLNLKTKSTFVLHTLIGTTNIAKHLCSLEASILEKYLRERMSLKFNLTQEKGFKIIRDSGGIFILPTKNPKFYMYFARLPTKF